MAGESDIMAERVRYHSKLYLSEGITEKKLDKIKKKLEKKPLFSGVFLIDRKSVV